MKTVYPVTITKGRDFLVSYVPDLEINTQGENLADVIEMSRDAISLWIVSAQENGAEIPEPSDINAIKTKSGEILTLVDVNISEYREKINKIVRRSANVYN